MKPKADSWTNTFDKPTRLMEGKIGKTEIYNIRNNRGNIIKDSEVIKKIRKYPKQFYADKFNYLRQKGHNPSNTQTTKDQEQMNNINFIFMKETEFEVRKILPQRKFQVQMAYLMNSTKHTKQKQYQFYINSSRKLKKKHFTMHTVMSCMHAKSLQLCPVLCNGMDSSLPGCPVQGFPNNTGVGYHAVLQEIFPTQGSNSSLLWLLQWQAVYFL